MSATFARVPEESSVLLWLDERGGSKPGESGNYWVDLPHVQLGRHGCVEKSVAVAIVNEVHWTGFRRSVLVNIFSISFRKSEAYERSLNVSLALWNKNYYKCLISIPKLPHLIGAMASLHAEVVRREILKRFAVAYQSRVLTVPTKWLMSVMIYSDEQKMIDSFRAYGIHIDEKAKSVRFSKSDFDFEAQTVIFLNWILLQQIIYVFPPSWSPPVSNSLTTSF